MSEATIIDPDLIPEPFEADDLLWLVAEMERTPSTLDELLDDLALRDIDVEPARVAELLAAAVADGNLTCWEHQGTGYVTLTPLGATKLDVELGECSDRFFPVGKFLAPDVARALDRVTQHLANDPQSIFSGYRPGDEHRRGKSFVNPAVYIDPTCPEPLDVLVDLESSGELLRDGHRVVIRQVLGVGLTWPVTPPRAEVRIPARGYILVRSVCRGCYDARIPRNAYCALCHRTGVDKMLFPVEKALLQTGRKTHAPGTLAGGTGRRNTA